jgi:hypothetical protein
MVRRGEVRDRMIQGRVCITDHREESRERALITLRDFDMESMRKGGYLLRHECLLINLVLNDIGHRKLTV